MVTLLTGQGGSGKTLISQTMGTAVAAGPLMTFAGKQGITGKAAGLFAEDPEAVLHVRQPRINASLDIGYDRIAGRYFPQSYFGKPAQLWRQGKPTELLQELEDDLSRIEALRFVSFDNAAVLFGGDENSRSEVTEFMAHLNGMADRLSIGLVLSAHPSKTQDGTPLRVTSGSTAWVNASRAVLELTPAEDKKKPTLKVIKSNHAPTGEKIEFEWRNKVLVPITVTKKDSSPKRPCQHVFLDLLAATLREGQHVSRSSNSGSNYAPKLFAKRPDSNNYSKGDFEVAMQSLFSTREIKVGTYKDATRHSRECILPDDYEDEGD